VLIGLLAAPLGLAGADAAADGDRKRTREGEVPADAEADLPRGLAGPLDDAVPEHQRDGDQPDHGGHLTARPRQLVPADHDVHEDDRRDGGEQQQVAADRVDVPDRGADTDLALEDHGVRVVRGDVGRQEHPDRQGDAADGGGDLARPQLREVHPARAYLVAALSDATPSHTTR
jgi:hypothetical protein